MTHIVATCILVSPWVTSFQIATLSDINPQNEHIIIVNKLIITCHLLREATLNLICCYEVFYKCYNYNLTDSYLFSAMIPFKF